jgi:ABC-type bacteriocin/lantibiotic exporter with double-glycine peptidase domain
VLYYEVPGMTLIPQQDNTSCWYASAQMLIQWKMDKLQACLIDLIPPELDAECRKIRDAGGGIVNSQILGMAERLGLRAVPPLCPTPEAIAAWLRRYGPLWVNGKQHIVVIAGIKGMNVKVYDPWPPKVGKVDWRSLADWYAGGTNPAGQPDSSRDGGAGVTAVFLHCP